MVAVSLKKDFFQAEDGILDKLVTRVQTCALPISEFTDKVNLSQFAMQLRCNPQNVFYSLKNKIAILLKTSNLEVIHSYPRLKNNDVKLFIDASFLKHLASILDCKKEPSKIFSILFEQPH